jgi:hypothetical protein
MATEGVRGVVVDTDHASEESGRREEVQGAVTKEESIIGGNVLYMVNTHVGSVFAIVGDAGRLIL